MKHIPNPFVFPAFILVLSFGAFPFGACTKTVTNTIYRDTTINHDTTIIQYRDTADKQIYIPLGGSIASQTTVPWVDLGIHVPAFDIRSYERIDSVVLVVSSFVSSGPGAMVTQLYDITDGKVIGGATVTSTTPALPGSPPGSTIGFYPYQPSANFIDSLPQKPIDLTISVHVTDNSTFGVCTNSYLILYRK